MEKNQRSICGPNHDSGRVVQRLSRIIARTIKSLLSHFHFSFLPPPWLMVREVFSLASFSYHANSAYHAGKFAGQRVDTIIIVQHARGKRFVSRTAGLRRMSA